MKLGEPLIDKLLRFAALAPNWDSYGGVALTEAALETAINLDVVPLADGGVQYELHAGGADVEIVIAPNGKVRSVSYEQRGQDDE